MKQVHNIRVRVVDRDKDHIAMILQMFLQNANIQPKDATVKYSDDGETDPLFIGELWLDHQQPVRKVLAYLAAKLPAEEKAQIHNYPEKFIDMATHCFLRLDKVALASGEVRFGNTESTAQVRLNIAAFPATKERAVPILKVLFG